MQINNETYNEILELASLNNMDMEVYEGTLNDSSIIYANKGMNIGGRTAKYIVVLATCLNEWSVGLKVRFINSDTVLEKIKQELEG